MGKEALGRIGLVGRAGLFAVVGMLAVQLAAGDVHSGATNESVIQWLASQPLGRFLLLALAGSLFALAGWRLVDAAVGDPVEGRGVASRAEYAMKGLVYLALAVVALTATIESWSASQVSGVGSGGGADQERKAAATVLEWPGGRWIVAAIGVVVIGFAVHQCKTQVIDQEFTQRLRVGVRRSIVRLGRFGYAARSVVYALVGSFLVQAGVTYRPGEAEGPSGSLRELSGHGWGQLLLWVVGAGLLAFAAFTVAEARYRAGA